MSVAPIAQNTEAVVWRCSVKKVLDILKISLQITYTRVSLFFSCFLRICIKCFSVNFAKFLIKTFFTEHFWWLLSMSWFPFVFQALSENFFWGLRPQSPTRVFPWTHWGTYSTLRPPALYKYSICFFKPSFD